MRILYITAQASLILAVQLAGSFNTTLEDIMVTFGQRLMGISHRGRWILFSKLVDTPDMGQRLLKAGSPKPKEAESSPFDNDFFRNARREQHSKPN